MSRQLRTEPTIANQGLTQSTCIIVAPKDDWRSSEIRLARLLIVPKFTLAARRSSPPKVTGCFLILPDGHFIGKATAQTPPIRPGSVRRPWYEAYGPRAGRATIRSGGMQNGRPPQKGRRRFSRSGSIAGVAPGPGSPPEGSGRRCSRHSPAGAGCTLMAMDS